MSKRFLEFIKTSQKYYREYIQELASTFGGIPELEAIAQRVSTEGEFLFARLFSHVSHTMPITRPSTNS